MVSHQENTKNFTSTNAFERSTVMNYSHLTTERLRLRKPTHSDLDDLFAVHSDPKTNAFNPAGAHTSLEQSREMLESWLTLWNEYGFGYWTVIKKDSPETVLGFGGLSLKEVEGEVLPNLYFRFSPAAWGKGYASEMGRAALEVGCTLLNYDEIVASVRPDNAPSVGLLERLGLEKYGEVKDQYRLSYLYKWTC